MKSIVVIVALIGLVALGAWQVIRQNEVQRVADAEAARIAALATPEARRAALFGPEAAAPEIQWRPSGFGYRIAAEGTGPRAIISDKVLVHYVGRLKDGTIFDQSQEPKVFPLNGVIPGMTAGLQLLAAGGKATFFIPPNLGYGGRAVGPIPANSGLIFEVEVVTLNP